MCRVGLGAALALAALLPASASLWDGDLRRARTRTPRSGYRGQGSLASANARLNKHLSARRGLQLKACEDFSVPELRGTLRTLFQHASDELKGVYPQSDGRRALYAAVEDMEAHWADSAPVIDTRVRDAHCHEAVMWFVHHLTSEVQERIAAAVVLPKLPVADHRVARGQRNTSDVAGKFYDEKVTCQACHVAGVDDLHLPEEKPATDKAKARRCYTNYKELFNVTCGPCDGVAGPYWGDSDDFFKPTDCLVVGTPEEIPENERIPPKLPPQFTVDVVGGSDRFGRTTNPINDTLPGPIAKIYGQIHGKWYMDAKPGADLWLLRHDTVYGSVTEDGTSIPFISPSLTEIHAQTAKQRTENVTGPMVSLIHGMPDWIPGGCTCIQDPVGVPDITATLATGMANMQYMGRIKLPELEYLKVPIELDHWANWFFHIFMDTNSSVPHFRQAPSRLASAYAGTAVYDNWIFEDPAIRDPDVWHRGIPTSPEIVGPDKGKMCMNTQKSPICANISQATFPPRGEAAVPGWHAEAAAVAAQGAPDRLPFLPGAHAVHEAVSRIQTQEKLIV